MCEPSLAGEGAKSCTNPVLVARLSEDSFYPGAVITKGWHRTGLWLPSAWASMPNAALFPPPWWCAGCFSCQNSSSALLSSSRFLFLLQNKKWMEEDKRWAPPSNLLPEAIDSVNFIDGASPGLVYPPQYAILPQELWEKLLNHYYQPEMQGKNISKMVYTLA